MADPGARQLSPAAVSAAAAAGLVAQGAAYNRRAAASSVAGVAGRMGSAAYLGGAGRGSHSFAFQLNVSAFCGIRVTFRGRFGGV